MNGLKSAACLAGLLASSLASAKDLPPRKAETPRAVTGCEYFGEGYVKTPGSDTCVRVSGSVRMEGRMMTNR